MLRLNTQIPDREQGAINSDHVRLLSLFSLFFFLASSRQEDRLDSLEDTLFFFSLYPDSSIMAASKAESQKVFEKLKTKPANKARVAPPSLKTIPANCFAIGLLRLRYQESYLVIGAFGYLLVSGLFGQPPEPGCSHLLCPLYKPRPYALPRIVRIMVSLVDTC